MSVKRLSFCWQTKCVFVLIGLIFIFLWISNEDILQIDYKIILPAMIISNNNSDNNLNIDRITIFNPDDDYIKYLSNHQEIYDRFNKIGDDKIIYDNPMFDDQCRNALIYKENINIDKLIIDKECKICDNKNNKKKKKNNNKLGDVMWSRELLDALQRGYPKYSQSEAIRIPYYNDTVFPKNFKINTEITKKLPTYYMIAKCASSSIYTNLNTLFDKKVVKTTMHKTFDMHFIGDSKIINTNCGFTFVRNPITRFIAGYYTINRKIFAIHKTLYNASKLFISEGWNNRDNPENGWNFLSVYGEPQRFIAFIDEMLSNPYKFVHIDPMSHVTSILSKSFSVFYGSDIHFIGKIEYFNNHWSKLMNYCPWFNQHIAMNTSSNNSQHAMFQYGKSSHFNDYNKVLSVNQSKILPTAYYIIANNKTLYNRLVNYYWQDFVCFGYQPNWNNFKKYVKDLEIKTYKLTKKH